MTSNHKTQDVAHKNDKCDLDLEQTLAPLGHHRCRFHYILTTILGGVLVNEAGQALKSLSSRSCTSVAQPSYF